MKRTKRKYILQLGVNEARVSRYEFSSTFEIGADDTLDEIKTKGEEAYRRVVYPRCVAYMQLRREAMRLVRIEERKKVHEWCDEHIGWYHIHRIWPDSWAASCVPWKQAKHGQFVFMPPFQAMEARKYLLTKDSESDMVIS